MVPLSIQLFGLCKVLISYQNPIVQMTIGPRNQGSQCVNRRFIAIPPPELLFDRPAIRRIARLDRGSKSPCDTLLIPT